MKSLFIQTVLHFSAISGVGGKHTFNFLSQSSLPPQHLDLICSCFTTSLKLRWGVKEVKNTLEIWFYIHTFLPPCSLVLSISPRLHHSVLISVCLSHKHTVHTATRTHTLRSLHASCSVCLHIVRSHISVWLSMHEWLIESVTPAVYLWPRVSI